MKKKTRLSEVEIKLLDEIYQESIEECSSQWTLAREQNDPDIVLDEIWSFYDERIAAIFKVKEIDEVYDLFTEYGPRDWLYESIDAGIN